eukprot:EG_transcript_40615
MGEIMHRGTNIGIAKIIGESGGTAVSKHAQWRTKRSPTTWHVFNRTTVTSLPRSQQQGGLSHPECGNQWCRWSVSRSATASLGWSARYSHRRAWAAWLEGAATSLSNVWFQSEAQVSA